MSEEPRLTPETAAREPEWTVEGEFADVKLILHTLSNAVNSLALKMEVILRHIRRQQHK